jgi:hypothetical protein
MGAPVCLVEDQRSVGGWDSPAQGVEGGGGGETVGRLRRPPPPTGACEMRSGGIAWVTRTEIQYLAVCKARVASSLQIYRRSPIQRTAMLLGKLDPKRPSQPELASTPRRSRRSPRGREAERAGKLEARGKGKSSHPPASPLRRRRPPPRPAPPRPAPPELCPTPPWSARAPPCPDRPSSALPRRRPPPPCCTPTTPSSALLHADQR